MPFKHHGDRGAVGAERRPQGVSDEPRYVDTGKQRRTGSGHDMGFLRRLLFERLVVVKVIAAFIGPLRPVALLSGIQWHADGGVGLRKIRVPGRDRGKCVATESAGNDLSRLLVMAGAFPATRRGRP